jgi:hypothetical protein
MKHSLQKSSSQRELDFCEAIFIKNSHERKALMGIHDEN